MKCVLCSHEDFTTVINGISNPRKVGEREYSYLQCRNCHLWMLSPYPSQQELTQIYDSSYQLYEEESETLVTTILENIAGSRIDLIKKYLPDGSKIIDIGCGTGTFLKKLKNAKYHIHGTEWSESAGNKAKEKINDSNAITIGDINQVEEQYDAATMWHVLEHNLDPLKCIEDIKSKVPKGYLFIEVPNAKSLVLQNTNENYPWLSIPEHVTYWTDDSLKFLANTTGFEVVESGTPLAMIMLYAKAKGSYYKLLSPFLQSYAALTSKGDILRQVWKIK